ncbi:unnamed protein product [Urochloa humidicola]
MSGGGRKAAGPIGEEAEVEALLRAAQDAVLLKLQASSHLISSTSVPAPSPAAPLDGAAAAADPLEDDLARRFDALKSRASAAPAAKPAGAGAAAAGASGMDELEARFAALKGVTAAGGSEKDARVRLEDLGGESSEDEESEVDKVMRWAMDAARLDVATAGALAGDKGKRAGAEEEEEKDEKSSVSSEEEDDDEEEERMKMEMARKRMEMARKKTKSKWFFL